MKNILLSLLILTSVIGHPESVQAANAEVTSQCNSIQISPSKPVYLPGDTLTITVTGQGNLAKILVRYAPAKRNLIQVPYISIDIPGKYDPTSQTWIGTWTVPNQDGEYIIMPNLFQPNGQFCAGNPAYSRTTRQGTMAGGNLTLGATPCQGCHKTIIVDSYANAKPGDLGIYDMKEYWNLQPGYSWTYEGTNTICGLNYPTQNTHACIGNEGRFQARVTTEEKVQLAGVKLLPLRFTKSKSEGYMFPNRNSTLRIFLSYFEADAPWSSTTLGRPFALEYASPPSKSLSDLGPLIDTVRHYSNEPNVDFDNFYFAPQFLGKEFMPLGWKYEAIDRIYFFEGPQKIYSGNLDYKSNIRERWANNQLFYEDNVITPAYTGPALRLRLFEAGYPIGSGWHIREDWYFAKGIGRIRIDSIHCDKRLRANPNDPDCQLSSTTRPINPDLSMSLTNYYTGGSLQTRAEVDSTGTTWRLYAKSANGPYTGYLEAKNCISESPCNPAASFKWGYGDSTYFWMENGTVEIDTKQVVNLEYGLRHAWFRPWVETPPSGATTEKIITKTELPWSNETTWRISPPPLPGDFNTDNKVNLFDYNELVSKWNKPYTDLDYQNILINFGK